MQTCYNCGKQVSDETLICPDCGALVRRYTTPANPAVPQAQSLHTPEPAPAQVGRRLHGPVKVWLIILCAISAYMAFSCLCCAVLALQPEIIDRMLSQPGMELFEPLFESMRAELPALLPLYATLTVLFLAKSGCHLWQVLQARRLPFYLSIAVSFAAIVCAVGLGGTLSVVLHFLDPVITWLGLRRFWPQMRK